MVDLHNPLSGSRCLALGAPPVGFSLPPGAARVDLTSLTSTASSAPALQDSRRAITASKGVLHFRRSSPPAKVPAVGSRNPSEGRGTEATGFLAIKALAASVVGDPIEDGDHDDPL